MREIVLDTETTGRDPKEGHRVVEIGCVELVNLLPTGRSWHHYLNPERDMPADAQAVHGLSADFLATKPVFAEVVDEFLAFIGESPLIIHNAAFDMGFLNAELTRLGFAALPPSRAVDTVLMARRAYPGQRASLDALCERFGVDKSARADFHGALLDARLLAEVYLELKGGKQPTMLTGLGMTAATNPAQRAATNTAAARPPRAPRPHAASDAEQAAHRAFVGSLKNPLWPQWWETTEGREKSQTH